MNDKDACSRLSATKGLFVKKKGSDYPAFSIETRVFGSVSAALAYTPYGNVTQGSGGAE